MTEPIERTHAAQAAMQIEKIPGVLLATAVPAPNGIGWIVSVAAKPNTDGIPTELNVGATNNPILVPVTTIASAPGT